MSKAKSNNINQRKLVKEKRAYSVSTAALRTQAPPGLSLYEFVYKSALCAFVTVVLISSFLIQGVYVVYANELPPEDDLVAIPVETIEEPPVVEEQIEPVDLQESVSEEPAAVTDVSESPDTTTDTSLDGDTAHIANDETDVNSPVSDETGLELTPTDTLEDNSEASTTADVDSSGGGGTEEAPEETVSEEVIEDTEIEDNSGGGGGAPEETGTSTEMDVSTTSAAVLETASSSEALGPGLLEPISVNYTDSGFTFSKNECTELASGSFYCLEPRENALEDALFAAPDKDGDLEIFLVRNGAQTQITDNFIDDAAPFFDQNSETIVWHRLIDDRYQIIAYDLASGKEDQLTKNGTNNMEPIRQGKYTVWQRWVANNWDIILSDGVKEKQISHASAHDIAPYIHGSLVVWNRYGATGEKSIEMFDIKSETYVTVDDPEGLSVTNPRMVLVYDQMHPNGDIVTKGYDMIARKFIQLDTLPRELPDEIPASEPTSETRALIQSKPAVKGDEVVQEDIVGAGEPPLPNLEATSTDSLTLDLSQETTETPVTVDTVATELSDFDLIITPLASSTETASSSVQE
jgi:hypothetical protein